MIKRSLIVLGLAVCAVPALGQNLLLNPSFSLPAPAVEDCGFHKGAPADWTPIGGLGRNGDIFYPACPHGDPADYLRASVSVGGGGSPGGSQTITLPTAADGATYYKFSGLYSVGSTDASVGATASFTIFKGATQIIKIGESNYNVKNGSTPWTPFSVTALPAAGTTQLTVRFQLKATAGINGMHVDDMVLAVETTCPFQPTLPETDVMTPDMGMRGTVVNVTINGTDFSDYGGTDTPVVRLIGPATIEGTGVSVVGPTQIQATFAIPADAVHEDYTLEIVQNGCTPITAPNAFLVYLPGFSNASFEGPDTTTCDVPAAVVPTEWRVGESNEWGWSGRLMLNGSFIVNDQPAALAFKPSCPPKDGKQYGTMSSDSGTGAANAVAYQTLAVTPGTSYTWSGYFAGSGDNRVTLRMRDGGLGDADFVAKDIHEGAGNYDWSFNFVTGTPLTNVMTLEWHVYRTSGTQNTSHADAMTLEQCTTPIAYLSSITPNQATNDGVLHVTDITGSGFTGTPTVFLSKPGFSVVATNVVVIGSTNLTADFDLTGVPGGRYSLFVKQGGCLETLPESVVVVAAEFVNGDFEDPTAPLNCNQPIGGIPTGWNTDTNMMRDGNAPVAPSCPSTAGGHYGTMSSGDGGTLRAWQTVRVVPGQPYSFSGIFGGSADCVISLLDGDEFGTVIQSETVYTGGSGSAWLPGSVTAIASSSVMTVMWEIQNATMVSPGGHADGLSFGTDCPLNWADTDADGDVDMDDFAEWQRCVTVVGEIPAECRCLDRVAPYGQIDLADFPAFAHCVSGPNIPWTSCEP